MIRWIKCILKQCFGLPAPFNICMMFEMLMFQISLLNCVFCNELTLDRSRALSCRSSEGSVVRGFVRGSLVWSIMGCFQYKESRKENKEEYLENMPNLLTTQPKIFQLIFAWSKARISVDLLGSPLTSMTFAMSCSYSVPTLPVPPPAATVRW